MERSEYLLKLIEQYATPQDSILEIGAGDYRNVNYLRNSGYTVEGIDKKEGSALEDVEEEVYDIIYTMSCLFLIDPLPAEKIARMTGKYLITIEGETTKGEVIGRDYQKVFEPLGFTQIYHEEEVFNKFGVARVFKKTS